MVSIIEELQRQRSAPPSAKKKTTTTKRKASTTRVTRRKPLDDFGWLNETDAQENQKTLQVELRLTVQGNNKFIRGVKKVREEIERDVLSQYQMKKKWEDGFENTGGRCVEDVKDPSKISFR